ncbi:Carbonic anhydrase 1 [Blattella germanica]|nr:Carbonic anhydrase 1 [Blattella germanica]
MMFHWGPCDSEGSEHTLDNKQYAMELQMIHVKKGYSCPMDVIAPVDNPLLDQVVNNIFRITQPGNTVAINPFPLTWIYPSFACNYYTYYGSMTQPPCSEAVIWIIQPEGLAVSTRQVSCTYRIFISFF